jgi:hypothetical protein
MSPIAQFDDLELSEKKATKFTDFLNQNKEYSELLMYRKLHKNLDSENLQVTHAKFICLVQVYFPS